MSTTRVKITHAAFEQSKAGNNMVHITLDADGEKINHYITNMPDKKELTTKLLNQFFDAFDIKRKNFEFDQWIGKEADAVLVDSEWNGRTYKKVKYFIIKKFVPSPEIKKVIDQIKTQQQEDDEPEEPEKVPEQKEVEPEKKPEEPKTYDAELCVDYLDDEEFEAVF